MLLSLLIQIPLIGIFIIACLSSYEDISEKTLKTIALSVTIFNFVLSLAIWIFFDNSSKHYQFVQEHHNIAYYDFYLGLDSLSVFFVLLTTLITPLAIMSNWKSIKEQPVFFLTLILLLESALLLIFLVLDILMFYIFFESILAPLFILIGVFGSSERIRAGFYFFLYTFLGSLFMLLSIITMLSLIGCTDFDVLSKANFVDITQIFLFIGIFIAFAVKTPVIYLNGWLLKAHVESPLSGSIVLAAIVLKLSLYGVFRLVLPLVPKALLGYTFVIFVICVITILYASLSTIRTIDVKELIAYSSVSHAVVYLAGIVSNTIHGIQGGIALGLAHGFVSSGLFITAGGVLYDRSSTRLISYYSGIAQIMPILSILYFILSLGNCGAPLTLNFVGEFMALYGVFERLPIAGILGSTSIVFSAAYTIYMYNRIAFGGSNSGWYWEHYIPDINKREFNLLIILVIFTVGLGIYPAIVLDSLNYSVSGLLTSFVDITHLSGEEGSSSSSANFILNTDSAGFTPFRDPAQNSEWTHHSQLRVAAPSNDPQDDSLFVGLQKKPNTQPEFFNGKQPISVQTKNIFRCVGCEDASAFYDKDGKDLFIHRTGHSSNNRILHNAKFYCDNN